MKVVAPVTCSTPQTNTTATLQVNAPAGLVEGNLLLAWIRNSSNTAVVSSPGWTLVGPTTNNTSVLWHRVTAAEAAAVNQRWTFTASAGSVANAVVAQYSGALADGNPIVGYAGATGGTSTPIGPALEIPSGVVPGALTAYGVRLASANTVTPPAGFSSMLSGSRGQHVLNRQETAEGGTGVVNPTFGSSTQRLAWMVVILPEPEPELDGVRVFDGVAEQAVVPHLWDGVAETALTAHLWTGTEEIRLA